MRINRPSFRFYISGRLFGASDVEALTKHIESELPSFIVLKVNKHIDHTLLIAALWDSAISCIIVDAFRFERVSDVYAFDYFELETAAESSTLPFRLSSLKRNVPKRNGLDLYEKLVNFHFKFGLSTSGTTATKPKLLLFTQQKIQSSIEAVNDSLKDVSNCFVYNTLICSYVFGLSNILLGYLKGRGIVSNAASPQALLGPISVKAISPDMCFYWGMVPNQVSALLSSGRAEKCLSQVMKIGVAGGHLSVPEQHRLLDAIEETADLFVMYGQTEAFGRISCYCVNENRDKIGSAGMPIEGVQLFVKETGKGVGKSSGSGELTVNTRYLADYVFELSELENTAVSRLSGPLATGDNGAIDSDGFLWIDGRVGSFVKLEAKRFSRNELQNLISSVLGNEPFLFDVKNDVLLIGGISDFSGKSGQICTKLEISSRSVKFFHLDELPVLENGKPDFRSFVNKVVENV